MKHLVNKFLNRLGYHLANVRIRQRDMFADRDFAEIYARAKDFTTTPPEGLFAIYTIVRSLVAANVPGTFVDCAAWKCGGTIAVIETLRLTNAMDREVVAFDLFDQADRNGHRYWNAADFSAVKAEVLRHNYPPELIRLVAGDMLTTIPPEAPATITFLRLDANRYEVTSHLMGELYPRLAQGGCIFVTDYGSYFAESGRATEEFLATLLPRPLVHRVDDSIRYWIKT